MDTLTRIAADFLHQRLNEKSNWQYTRLVKDITVRILSYSRTHGESEEAFSARVRDALSLVDDLQHGLHADTQVAGIWSHDYKDHNLLSSTIKEGRQSSHRKEVDRTAVRDVALRYLQRPWMENHLLEWMIVDSLLYAEIVAFAEEIVFDKEISGHVRSDRRALFVGVPICAVGTGILTGHAITAITLGIIYAALGLWIVREAKMSGQEKQVRLLNEMRLAYHHFETREGSIRDGLTISREQLVQVANKGAGWDNAAWAILDNAIRRTPPTWIFDQSSAYNWGDEVENDSSRHWPISLRLRTPLITRGLRTEPPLEPYTGSWRLPLSSLTESPTPIEAGGNT